MSSTKTDSVVLVVIPYLASEARGLEIEYACAGWREHFNELQHLVVVGDVPEMPGQRMTMINCPRVEGDGTSYLPALDLTNKLRVVRERFPKSKGFVLSYDDIFAVNDFNLDDILFPKIAGTTMPGKLGSENGWYDAMARTRNALMAEGLPTRNYSTHLPRYYEWDKLGSVLERWGEDSRMILENLYFNTYPPKGSALVLDGSDRFKYFASTSRADKVSLLRAFSEKVWINTNVDGFEPVLESMLREHYDM